MLTAGDILKVAKNYVTGSIEDTLPIIVAVADPSNVLIGATVQHNYPLGRIQREFGIPFGAYRNNPARLISDRAELHALKWGLTTHADMFRVEAMVELFEQGRQAGGQQIAIALSTGMGNVLQNLRSVMYKDGRLHHVTGENFDALVPYPCCIKQADSPHIGVELLLFTETGGCLRVNKEDYLLDRTNAIQKAEPAFERQLSWAVSGYPLFMGGRRVPPGMTAESVGDYRHLWQLPRMNTSIAQHIADAAKLTAGRHTAAPPAPTINDLEFYFGQDLLKEPGYFEHAIRGDALTFPLDWPVTEAWRNAVPDVCRIANRHEISIYPDAGTHLKLDLAEVRADLIFDSITQRETGYKEQSTVRNPGDFHMDTGKREVTIKLKPGIYPEHILGISDDEKPRIVNISIGGQSGRSGITIEMAKQLCEMINLSDAIILDNGFDVVARAFEGRVIAHQHNIRETRLTAALHFGCPIALGSVTGQFKGFEMAVGLQAVKP